MAALGRQPWRPGEHSADSVKRWVASCVDLLVAWFVNKLDNRLLEKMLAKNYNMCTR
jgi:hypothetical protein